ncbi:aldo/keto reductase [Lutimaribacter saemankumensis]|uniref:2,5-diketo-D-gluconate reductase A n=1 Tax=Lutimaribacter saemankumensis TaxID=490829 RepID=A0A1G8K3P8_9RHOB|nr:aldo/keto reductase [Lutimaribacter saemankumensis]SDI38058.1 2,5-diketo-D-gluconate reductase A [Lutimaribacter saemankumensis]
MTSTQPTFRLNAETAIPAVGFGTYLISNDDAPDAICAAIANGYRHIDTASGYHNEAGVGEGIRRGLAAAGISRNDIFVTTKLWPGNPAWGDAPKTHDQTIAECDASLERLGLAQVDLYLIHAPYGGDQRLDQWRALLELKKTGKAQAIGVSNFNIGHLEEIKAAGLPMPDANQIELHPWSQKPDLLRYMADHGIAPIAYSSLVPLSTWRATPGQDSAKTDEMKADGGAFAEMATKYSVSEAQLLLRWGVQNGYAVLPKSLNPDRMRQNLDLFSFSIDDADMAQMATMDRGDGVAWATGDPSK